MPASATMSHDHEVTLANQQILLRAFRLEDADAIYEAVRESLPELLPWLPWCHAEYSRQETEEFLTRRAEAFRTDEEYAFAIIERATGRFVGATGINQLDRGSLRANLGYWLRTSAKGHGYATQGTLLVARWAFESLALERIEIVAATANLASQRVAQRAGAVREGIARARLRIRGQQRDGLVFSLVPSDLAGDNTGS